MPFAPGRRCGLLGPADTAAPTKKISQLAGLRSESGQTQRGRGVACNLSHVTGCRGIRVGTATRRQPRRRFCSTRPMCRVPCRTTHPPGIIQPASISQLCTCYVTASEVPVWPYKQNNVPGRHARACRLFSSSLYLSRYGHSPIYSTGASI